MEGVLRIIPASGSGRPQRLIVLRTTPSLLMLRDLVGGQLEIVDGFETILVDSAIQKCVVFRREGGADLRPNIFGNLLWLQAQIRKTGFAGAKAGTAHTITGPIAILYGEPPFMRALVSNLLQLDPVLS